MSNSLNFAMADMLLAADKAQSRVQANKEMRELEDLYSQEVDALREEQEDYLGGNPSFLGGLVGGGIGMILCGPSCASVGYSLGSGAVDIAYEEAGWFG